MKTDSRSRRGSGGRRQAAVTAAIVSFVTILPATAPVAASSTRSLHLSVDAVIGRCNLTGRAEWGGPLTVTLRAPNGDLKGRRRVLADSGAWQVDCLGPAGTVDGGDRLVLSQNGHRHALFVPRLTVQLDRDSDVVSGVGPPNTNLKAFADEVHGFTGFTVTAQRQVVTDDRGRYAAHFGASSFDLKGGDDGAIGWFVADDTVLRYIAAPQIVVYRDEVSMQGVTAPGDLLHVSVHRATGTKRGTALGVADGGGYVRDLRLADSSGRPVRVHLGDEILSDAAADAHFVMPDVILHANAVTDTLSGRCLPSRQFQVLRSNGERLTAGRTNADGAFAINLAGGVDLRSGDVLVLDCRLPTGDVAGDQVVIP